MERLKITKDYDNVNWSDVIKVLMAYAYVLIGDENEKMKISRTDLAYDYSMETITLYLNDKSKFDPSRNPDLINYLKYNILRQIISNSKMSGNFKYESSSVILEKDSYISKENFLTEYKLDEKIDTDKIIKNVEEKIADDCELLPLFKGRYYDDSKRSEICKDLDISEKEYDNRIKRLRRLVKKEIIATTDNG